MQKFVFRSALRPNQISFSRGENPSRHLVGLRVSNKDRVSPDCRCYDHPSTWMASEPSYSSLPTTVTKDVYRDFWKIKCSTV